MRGGVYGAQAGVPVLLGEGVAVVGGVAAGGVVVELAFDVG